jgi:hypothetical protein
MCIISGCNNKPVSRGLCPNCYSSARLAIKAGHTTWSALERVGLSLPPAKKRGSGNSLFSQAFERQRKEIDRIRNYEDNLEE